jgi:hypothetical protein
VPDRQLRWHPALVEVWAHDDTRYEVNSYYSLPDDAWQYELVSLTDAPGTGPYLMVLIPDATPADEPFTPMGADHVRVLVGDGQAPWPVLRRFVQLIEDSGDIVHGHEAGATIGELTLSNNPWRFAGRRFEVNSFHFSDQDCWCYELYEVDSETTGNNYIEVQIPDLQPAEGPLFPRRQNW